jgi:hypothetical protein
MSILEKPPIPPHSPERPRDDLDGLLYDFYRAEMPNPWPGLKPPAARDLVPFQPARRWPGQRSRWVLAASVILLLIGQLFLLGRVPDYSAAPAGSVTGDVHARRDRSGTTTDRKSDRKVISTNPKELHP